MSARSIRKTLSELLRLWFENYSVQAVVLELVLFVFLFSVLKVVLDVLHFRCG